MLNLGRCHVTEEESTRQPGGGNDVDTSAVTGRSDAWKLKPQQQI